MWDRQIEKGRIVIDIIERAKKSNTKSKELNLLQKAKKRGKMAKLLMLVAFLFVDFMDGKHCFFFQIELSYGI